MVSPGQLSAVRTRAALTHVHARQAQQADLVKLRFHQHVRRLRIVAGA